MDYLLAAFFCLFVWWFSTGAVIYLDGLPKVTLKWTMLGASLLLVLSLFGLHATADNTTAAGAYLAFTCGLLAWAWHEVSFYTGYVTGPRKVASGSDRRGLKHFWNGVQLTLWHEFAIIAGFALIVFLTWDGANRIGLWTFVVLWWMHESAKLNVFFGVRNLNAEFLPEHLAYLKSYFRKRPMNLLFPFSVTVSTIICFVMFSRAFAQDATQFDAIGYTFLGILMALAILEHWFLVIPLPFAKLWHWALSSRKPTASRNTPHPKRRQATDRAAAEAA
ncbi:MAG: putative photosynthetic complex assembly protein PuhE [Pseudomonadota bacterium]